MDTATSTLGLIERIRKGDQEAFRLLFEKYRRRLAVKIHYRLGSQLRQFAEVDDVFQAVCLRAFADFDQFHYQTPGSFMRWLSSIADHVITDLARYQGRQKRQASELVRFRSESNPLGPEPADTQTPSRLFAENEGLRRLLQQMNALPEDYREVLLLAKVEGLTSVEISEKMGRSREAVALLLHRAIKRLRVLRELP